MRPLIGISCDPELTEEIRRQEYQHYISAIEYAGGEPILLPQFGDLPVPNASLSRLDGLLLSGGSDLHPSMYGEEPHPLLGECNRQLDRFELPLTYWALQNDLPLLGICRGMQLINVALGGTLYQDLRNQYSGSLNHKYDGEPYAHQVFVEESCRMKEILGTSKFWVNSRHHQALRKLGRGVRVTGRAEDGVAELFEIPHRCFAMGMQCHPEEIYTDVSACAHLFLAFTRSCSMHKYVDEDRTTRKDFPSSTLKTKIVSLGVKCSD